MKKYVLIVSGGDGKRLQSDHPKQFLEINGLPLLMHTFYAFSFLEAEFILMLQEKAVEDWRNLCRKHDFNIPHQIEIGGPKRFHSVKSGLKSIPDNVLLAIHDGVRPLVSRSTITQAFEMAAMKGNAVPAMPVSESIRESDGSLNKAVDRSKLKAIQTPQVFKSAIIKKAYNQPYDVCFTDDATVLESDGYQIHLTEGNPENIKITHSIDLAIAKQMLSGVGRSH